MAKVILDQQVVVVKPWWARVRIVFTGAGLGLLWWVLTALLRHYIVEPLACRDLSTAATCVNSIGLAGSIATVIIGVLGAFLLVRTQQARPVIISVATAILLWNLGTSIGGLTWYEGLIWGIVLYALTYVLFGLIARIVWLPAAVITAIVTVLVIRILLAV